MRANRCSENSFGNREANWNTLSIMNHSLRSLVLFWLITFQALATNLSFARANQLAADSRLATVVSLDGKVWEITPAHQRLLLTVGEHLKPKTIIETEEASTAVLKLGTDVAIQVKPKSHFEIDLEREVDWWIKLETGAVLSAVRNPEKRPNHFKIKTRFASMGVRGTAFFVKEQPDQPAYLCTCHGTIQVLGLKDTRLKTITTTHHEHPVTIGKSVVKVPMDQDHTDADVTSLEKLL